MLGGRGRVPPNRADGDLVDPGRSDDFRPTPGDDRPADLAVARIGIVAMGDVPDLSRPAVGAGEYRKRVRLRWLRSHGPEHSICALTVVRVGVGGVVGAQLQVAQCDSG